MLVDECFVLLLLCIWTMLTHATFYLEDLKPVGAICAPVQDFLEGLSTRLVFWSSDKKSFIGAQGSTSY